MAYTTINDPTQYFNTVLYTGNGSTQSITGVGFQPDWTWIKRRNTVGSHALMDSSRGEDKFLESHGTAAEVTFASNNFTFTSDGYDLDYTGGYNNINQSGTTYVGWNWLANGGTTSSNTDGSITSTVQANTTAGFSVVLYTGNATDGATIGHGLNQTPELIIVKNRTTSGLSWPVYHKDLGVTKHLYLDTTDATLTRDRVQGVSSTTFEVDSIHEVNNNTDFLIAYCFHSVKGYSKFGSYKGNGSADGTFVYTGFKPAWLMIRNTISGEDWLIWDVTRDVANALGNPMTGRLKANDTITEVNGNDIDFLSNGFKIRTDSTYGNGSGNTIIYMAFAESPFVSSDGVPTTAR